MCKGKPTLRGVVTGMVTPWILAGSAFIFGGMGLIDPGPGDFSKLVNFWSGVVGFQIPMIALTVLGACKVLCITSLYGFLGKEVRTVANLLALAPCTGAYYMHGQWGEPIVPPIIMGSLFLGLLVMPDGPLWDSSSAKKD